MTDNDAFWIDTSEEAKKKRLSISTNIGTFIYNFSAVEASIREIALNIMALNSKSSVLLTAILDFDALCRLTISLLKDEVDLSSEELQEWLKLLNKARDLAQKRNVVAHATWSETAASHASRSKGERVLHFENEDELPKLNAELLDLDTKIFLKFLVSDAWIKKSE